MPFPPEDPDFLETYEHDDEDDAATFADELDEGEPGPLHYPTTGDFHG